LDITDKLLVQDRGKVDNQPMPYEHKSQPLLPRHLYLRRLISHGLVALSLLAVALAAGICGYHCLEGFSLIDSLLNASMILGGMGPVGELKTDAGKLFASAYAIFSGVVFIAVAGILVAPVAHRVMHRLHLESKNRRGGN
jgi:hypothetical protein